MYKQSVKKSLVLVILLIVGCGPKPDQTHPSPIVDSIDILASKNTDLNRVISEKLEIQPGRYNKFFVLESKESLKPQQDFVFTESQFRSKNWLFAPGNRLAISINATITEPEQSVDIYNRQDNKHVERLDVCGSTCKYIGIYWLDNSNFASVSISEYYASSGASRNDYVLIVSHYDLSKSTVARYKSSKLNHSGESESSKRQTLTSYDKQLQKIINSYIAGNEGKDSGYENKEARKIIYGDIDLDGDKDAVVKYTLMGAGGGNSYGQNLAVFKNTNGQFEILLDEVVGGKFYRSFNLENIADGRIYGVTETCADTSQGLCQNPKVEQVTFVVQDNKLKEE